MEDDYLSGFKLLALAAKPRVKVESVSDKVCNFLFENFQSCFVIDLNRFSQGRSTPNKKDNLTSWNLQRKTLI